MSDDDEIQRAQARRGQALVQTAAAETFAPPALRERLAAPPRPCARRRRALPLLAGVATAAAGAAALALVLVSGSTAPPRVDDIALVALRAPTAAAPAQSNADPRTITADVDGVTFPYWDDAYGFRASGRRADVVGGRRALTIFYRHADGRRLAYSIVAGPALAVPAGTVVRRQGNGYTVVRTRQLTTVTWRRAGHTCVLSAPPPTDAPTLLALAAGTGTGTGAVSY